MSSRLLSKLAAKLVAALVYRRTFAAFGPRSFIVRPMDISGQQHIRIGANVRVRDNLRMEAIATLRVPRLSIGDNTNIEQNVHIICSSEVDIGANCSITANCCIVDTSHPFVGIGTAKIADLLNPEPSPVRIGEGCLIGTGAVILPNVQLGRRCIVGANAVVVAGTYEPGSVLVGVPARVVRVLLLTD